MTALRDTRSLRWQAALARAKARNHRRFMAEFRVAFAAVADSMDKTLLAERRLKDWAMRAFCKSYLSSPAFLMLPAPPQQETRPVPEEAPAILTVDFAARALVQHPDALHEELAAAAQVTVNPAWLEDWRLANSATPTDPRLRRFHYDPDPNRERYNYRAPEMTIRRPATLAEAIQAMDPLPTRVFRTRTRDDEVEESPELHFLRWTDEFLFYKETPDAAMERAWQRQTVQEMLCKGTLAIRGPRPEWARPVERHAREAA